MERHVGAMLHAELLWIIRAGYQTVAVRPNGKLSLSWGLNI